MSEALLPAPNVEPAYADLIGKPFKLTGRGPDSFDCYGLVMELGRRAGWQLPDHQSPEVLRQVASVFAGCLPIWKPCEPGPGAVACIRMLGFITHVAWVLPHGRLIHVWEKSGGVCVERISTWERRIAGFYRYI